MAGRSRPQDWRPLKPGPGAGDAILDRAALAEPPGWTEPRLVAVAPDVDLFAASVRPDAIEAVVAVIAATPQHSYLLLTACAKRLLALGNEGLSFPRNLWVGVPVGSEEDVWRAEDVLRCNTARTWVLADPITGPIPSLPVSMLAWVVCRAGDGADGDGADWAGLDWVRDLRDRCRAAGVAFRFEAPAADGTWAPAALDGEVWDQEPAGLVPSGGR